MLSVSLTGCSQGVSDKADKLASPDIINYTPTQEKLAATEMLGGSCPMLNEFIIDYGVMRDQTRILRGENVNIER